MKGGNEIRGDAGMTRSATREMTREIAGKRLKKKKRTKRKKTNVHYFKLRWLKRVRIIVNYSYK